MNWIDTAAVYGDGHSEELVGRALANLGPSRRPIVATKCGRIVQPDGSVKGSLTPESVRAECEASLRRLGVETIDLYQMHWPDPDEQIESGWETMAKLREEGKVRWIGVSNCAVEHLERLRSIHPITSLQPPYNLIVRSIEDEILPYCGEHGIGVVSYSPMGKGLLTGRFDRKRAEDLPDDDHRSRDPKFAEPQLSLHLELVDGMRPIAEGNGKTLAQLAIAWVLRRPEVTSAIVGARRPGQITDTAPAGDWELSPGDAAAMDELIAKHSAGMEAIGASTGRV